MAVRAQPALVPQCGSKQVDVKAAHFPVLSCETLAPLGAKSALVAGHKLVLPTSDLRRIVVIGDTGCTSKASDSIFQDCNNITAWPFSALAQQAAAQRPDLVVHLGDMHYRESPCSAGVAGCEGSPWGYGFDV